MTNRIAVTLICLLALLVAAPVLAQDDEMMTDWTCPEGYEGQELNVYNWTTYIAEDTIANFEELCGVTVTYDTYESSDALLSRLRQGNPGYDVIVPSGSTMSLLIAEELVVPLNYDLIPNVENLSEGLMGQSFDPENTYSVPYQWGTVGVGYNITAVGEEITSWDQVWNYDGNVAWLEDNRAMIGTALNILGYDPNTDDLAEIEEASDYLIENSGNLVYIAPDDGQEVLVRGEADIVIEYNGDIFQVIEECECEDYAFAIPQEGANVWTDNLAIPAGGPNPDLANVFIDYILSPQVGADISNYTAYASPNQAAIDAGLIEEEYLSSTAIYPDEEALENLWGIISNPDLEPLYTDAWDLIKIAAGR